MRILFLFVFLLACVYALFGLFGSDENVDEMEDTTTKKIEAVTKHPTKTNLRAKETPNVKKIFIGIVAACNQERFYRFLDINNSLRKWDEIWRHKIEFFALNYRCPNPRDSIEFPSNIHGFKLRISNSNRPFSRASNINQMMEMIDEPRSVLLIIDVDIQMIEHLFWKLLKYVRPGVMYFPKIWSNYSPRSIEAVENIAKFDISMYSTYQGTWRKYGYGMFAIHREDTKYMHLNESFKGWGGEDKDFFQKANNHPNITIIRWQEPHLIHIWYEKDCSKITKTLKAYQDCLSSRSNYDSSKLGLLLLSSKKMHWTKERAKKLESAFVCITGQMKRLELQSKMSKLIVPLLQTFKHVYVGLALSSGKTYFTNLELDPNHDRHAFLSVGEAKSQLKSIGVKDVYFKEPELGNIELNRVIMSQYDKVSRGGTYRAARGRNHIRQYQTIATCSSILNEMDLIPEISIRIRDDAFISHFDIEESLRKLHFEHTSMFIVTEDCAAWRGINDKFALTSGKVSHQLFEAPIKHYPSENIPEWVINPETFFMHSYLMEGLQTITSDSIQIVTSTPVWDENCWKMIPRGVADCEKQIIVENSLTTPCIKPSELTLENFLHKTVLTIKTYERPECLFALLRSIKLMPIPMDVIIGDDSQFDSEHEAREILGDWLVSYMKLPYNSGTGYGRNQIVSKALELGYEYFIMSDDDYIIQDATLVNELARIMISMPDADIIAPQRCEQYGDCHMGHAATFSKYNDELFMMVSSNIQHKIVHTEVVQQFFLAKSSIGPIWDDKLKCNDHYDAMLTLKKKGKKLYTDYGVQIFHNKKHCQKNNNYAQQRKSNWLEAMPYVLEKWSIKRYYDEFGRVWEIDNETSLIKTQCGVLCTKKPLPSVDMDGHKWTYGKCQYFTDKLRKYNAKDCPVPNIIL